MVGPTGQGIFSLFNALYGHLTIVGVISTTKGKADRITCRNMDERYRLPLLHILESKLFIFLSLLIQTLTLDYDN